MSLEGLFSTAENGSSAHVYQQQMDKVVLVTQWNITQHRKGTDVHGARLMCPTRAALGERTGSKTKSLNLKTFSSFYRKPCLKQK